MLVLSRRKGETITIGENITVTIAEICGNQVRLGIDAPRDIEVHRLEIKEKIDAQRNPTK